ncbi:Disease resistance protein RPP13 [Triticum urartu]|uniref:Disease resistance protein RPP13 n=2 Tax=Triticum urartu TaxID=4572 RepID=M7ZDK7_TRIUA|nr:disease resistance protein RGA4-like [Triticum urartu]EMS46174.1 Disease resistance protein RPP13 [Triticum urartu]
MEVVVAVASAAATSVVPKLFTVLENKLRGLEDIEEDVRSLHRELGMISASSEDQISHKGQPSPSAVKSMKEFCDLAHNIEDCLDQFIPCAECGKGELKIRDPSKFRDEIARLKRELDAAQQRKDRYVVAESNVDNSSTADVEDTGRTYEACPAVGIEQAKEELRALLVGGEASKLRVVSIVGFGGSGKTALAWEVYNCPQVAKEFSCRAWATMACKQKHDISGKEALLKAIQKGLLGEKALEPVQQTPKELEDNISHLLRTNRCLVVIDNIKMELWHAIKHIFPDETESRILVTTTVTTVANACSNGYVYIIRSLSAKQSKDYLDKKLSVHGCSLEVEWGTPIVKKCDGHPLALVSVVEALQGCRVVTRDHCEAISENLGSQMEENWNGHFTKLQQVLMNDYSSLPDNSSRACLLYTSIFPNGRPFNTNSLTRRLSAEGYIKGDDKRSAQQVAYDRLDKLMDRNIIRPIDAHNNSKVKTCRTHGIMNQLMLYKSRSLNFISTSFNDKNRSDCRHLVIQNHRNGNSFGPATSGKAKQLRPRSLTVFGSAGEAVSELKSCELLRVLDLKECNDLNDQHLKDIYKLLHIKYLTLGSSVSRPLDGMKKLHCLETLDLRKRKIETLPLEVISLPHLAYLLGKFKLSKLSESNLKKFGSKKCNLKTVAGVVVDSDSGFPKLMVHMNQLRKVKIWCEPTGTDCDSQGSGDSILDSLSLAIQKFAKAGIDTPVRDLDTPVGDRGRLSLHFNNYSEGLLHGRDDPTFLGYLSSLKLQGRLRQFPQFVMSICGLEELCLSYTNLTGDDLLKGLCHLQRLVYLKLVEVHLADLYLEDGDLPRLQRLCLVVQKPIFPTIRQGALPKLTSVQLLCDGLEDLGGIEMELFKDLQEIALDSMVSQETIKFWEDEAKKHPRRPRVILLDKVVAPAEAMAPVKYVASRKVYNNWYADAPQRKLQRSCQVTPLREQSPPPRSQSDEAQVRNGLALLSCCEAPEAREAEGGRDAGLKPLHSSSVEQPNKTVPSIMPNGSKEV